MSYNDPQGVKVALELNPSGTDAPEDHPDKAVVKSAYANLVIGATSEQETVATAGTAVELTGGGGNMAAGLSLEAEAGAASGRLTSKSKAIYKVKASGEALGSAGVTQVSLALDGGAEIASTLKTLPASADYQPFVIEHFLEVGFDSYVSLYLDSDTNGATVDVRALNFSMEKVKDSTAFAK